MHQICFESRLDLHELRRWKLTTLRQTPNRLGRVILSHYSPQSMPLAFCFSSRSETYCQWLGDEDVFNLQVKVHEKVKGCDAIYSTASVQ